MYKYEELLAAFPHPHVREGQRQACRAIADSPNGVVIEGPTGAGKTAVGIAALNVAAKHGPAFYVTPTKMQAAQVERQIGRRVLPVLGRSEYPCLYYEDRGITTVNAQESPCYMLKCEHRVDQADGRTTAEGATPCPYFQAKFEALRGLEQGGIVCTTTAFFLMNRTYVPQWRELDPALVVLDECHRTTDITRRLFEHSVTDRHLMRAAGILAQIDRHAAAELVNFVRAFRAVVRRRESCEPTLLPSIEVERILVRLDSFNGERLAEQVRAEITAGRIDPVADRETLKQLETVIRTVPNLMKRLRFAVPAGERQPLNFVIAFYRREDDPTVEPPKRSSTYHLTVRSYYVRPLIQKALGARIIAYSATIGTPDIFARETGIMQPFTALPAAFSAERTRVYMPTDTPSLSYKTRRRDDLKKTINRIARASKRFAARGQRSLVIVVSEEERRMAVEKLTQAGVQVLTYGTLVTARQAVERFMGGEGEALVGTVAQYAEGVDLPRGAAEVIFFLRPGYPPPTDPQAQFEQERFGNGVWALWNWRVMLQALQARGRNIRSARDVGVCFFMSQQFRHFLRGALPEWLKPAYRGDLTFDGCEADANALFTDKLGRAEDAAE